MANSLCSKCKVVLTSENCTVSRFSHGGPCHVCRNEAVKRRYYEKHAESKKKSAERSAEWRKNNRQRYLENTRRYVKENWERYSELGKKYSKTIKGKHNTLKKRLRKEGIPQEDLIWNFNFYIELIRDNECHYCLGPLSSVGHDLDCVDNEIRHRCFNVVPCCKSCNIKKMDDTSYEEMMMLAPALREIRLIRESKIGDLNGNFNSECVQSV